MTGKDKRFCYLTPDFPKSAYIVVLFFKTKKAPLMTLPLSNIFTSIEDISTAIDDFYKHLFKSKHGKNTEIMESAILIPITFQKLFPLKKDYWEIHTENLKFVDKILAFVPALANPHLYKLLVVPCAYIKKLNHWEFAVNYPFSIFTQDSEIEEFMYASKDVVEIKAKYAAFYSLGNPKRYHLETGEVTEIEKQSQEKPKIIN